MAHGDDTSVRQLTGWEKFTCKSRPHTTADMGMLVIGDSKQLIAPGDWIVQDQGVIRVLSSQEFMALYLPTNLDPSLQDLVDRLEDFKSRLGDKQDTRELIDSAITGLYLQAEVIAKCYSEKYAYDTRFLPQRRP